MVHALLRANRELSDAVESLVGPPQEVKPFVPNDFQKGILAALQNKALRTEALGNAVGDRRRLFRDPGGLPELQEAGLVASHPRLGYYRPDAPPVGIALEKSTEPGEANAEK